MCRILCIAGIKPEFRDNALKFIINMGKEMSFNNRDGLGYSAIDETGELFAERWLYNSEAFEQRIDMSELDKKMLKKYNKLLFKGRKYDLFGNLALDKMTSVTLHTRMATSSKAFFNTHPFVDKVSKTSLIHNGVISNVDELKNKISTCDSECILNEYLDWDVKNNPDNIQAVASNLAGSYACGVFGKIDELPYLDIFKSEHTSLSAAFVKELDTMVFTTNINDINDACRKLNFNIESSYECRPGVLLRLNALTGEHISSVEFKPGYVSKFDSKKNKQSVLEMNRSNHNISDMRKNLNDEDRTRQVINVLDNINGWVREGTVWKKKEA